MAFKAFKTTRAAPSAAPIEESASPFETGSDPEGKEPISGLKLDASGLPLVPQPSDHKDDPLVCRGSLPLLLDIAVGPWNRVADALLLRFP